MIQNTHYTKYQPNVYRTRTPIFWWVHNWVHARFILRELTSVSVASYALLILIQLRAVAHGAEAYSTLLTWFTTPLSIVLHGIGFLFVVFHSVTWFNLAPKALVLRFGNRPVPGAVITALNYIAWGVCSFVIAWMMLNA